MIYSLFTIFTFISCSMLYVIYNYSFSYTYNNIFRNEYQLIYHDLSINFNYSSLTLAKQLYEVRKKSKYRKIGYGGHPEKYIFNFPLDKKILISPKIYNNYVELLIFIHCRPDEFYERILSRKYINNTKYIKVIYITLNSNNNEINRKLKYEASIYNDLLQFNEISSYFNLSIQTAHMIIWSIKIQFKYLLKTDIDVYVNIPLIYCWLKKYYHNNSFFAVGKISKTYILRNKKYSHYVPRYIIKENIYPPYLQGVGYIIPYNTVILLEKSLAFVKPKIFIEDAFVGYMLKHNNISLIDISKYIIRDLPYNICSIIHKINSFMLIHGFYPIEIYYLSKMMKVN